MSIRVVYDHQIFVSQRTGGISRYFVETASRVAALPDFDVRIFAVGHVNEYLKTVANPQMIAGGSRPDMKRTTQIADKLSRMSWTLTGAKLKPDILHETYYTEQGLPAGKARRVTTVYDFTHEIYGNLIASSAEVAKAKAASIQRVDHIFCISENTKRDLLERFDVAPEKISVTHMGYSLILTHPLPAPPISVPYILYVGSRLRYKNFEGCLRAYADPKIHREFLLVCLGGGNLTAQEQDWMRESNIPADRVQQINGDDNLLATLYQNAACMIYPSLYEGFGIPPLEAMEQNCPVVCSNTSSLPEVVGDAAETCDPSDPDAIRAALSAVLFSPERAEELRERGKQRVKLFGWDRCAEQTAAAYRALMA